MLKALWIKWRINRYLKLRRKGQTQEQALKKAFLGLEQLADVLEGYLSFLLPNVGIFSISVSDGKILSFGPNWLGQSALVISLLGDIAPLLSAERQQKVLAGMKELTQHNWGGIRRPAAQVVKQMTAAKAEDKFVEAKVCPCGCQPDGSL